MQLQMFASSMVLATTIWPSLTEAAQLSTTEAAQLSARQQEQANDFETFLVQTHQEQDDDYENLLAETHGPNDSVGMGAGIGKNSPLNARDAKTVYSSGDDRYKQVTNNAFQGESSTSDYGTNAVKNMFLEMGSLVEAAYGEDSPMAKLHKNFSDFDNVKDNAKKFAEMITDPNTPFTLDDAATLTGQIPVVGDVVNILNKSMAIGQRFVNFTQSDACYRLYWKRQHPKPSGFKKTKWGKQELLLKTEHVNGKTKAIGKNANVAEIEWNRCDAGREPIFGFLCAEKCRDIRDDFTTCGLFCSTTDFCNTLKDSFLANVIGLALNAAGIASGDPSKIFGALSKILTLVEQLAYPPCALHKGYKNPYKQNLGKEKDIVADFTWDPQARAKLVAKMRLQPLVVQSQQALDEVEIWQGYVINQTYNDTDFGAAGDSPDDEDTVNFITTTPSIKFVTKERLQKVRAQRKLNAMPNNTQGNTVQQNTNNKGNTVQNPNQPSNNNSLIDFNDSDSQNTVSNQGSGGFKSDADFLAGLDDTPKSGADLDKLWGL